MFTLCSITSIEPRHHIWWHRSFRDKPLTSISGPSDTIAYGYDEIGRITSITDASHTMSFRYGQDGVNRAGFAGGFIS